MALLPAAEPDNGFNLLKLTCFCWCASLEADRTPRQCSYRECSTILVCGLLVETATAAAELWPWLLVRDPGRSRLRQAEQRQRQARISKA